MALPYCMNDKSRQAGETHFAEALLSTMVASSRSLHAHAHRTSMYPRIPLQIDVSPNNLQLEEVSLEDLDRQASAVEDDKASSRALDTPSVADSSAPFSTTTASSVHTTSQATILATAEAERQRRDRAIHLGSLVALVIGIAIIIVLAATYHWQL